MQTISFKPVTDTTNYWWLLLFSGIVLIGMGVAAIIYPLQSYMALCTLFAVGIITTGFLEVLFSINNHSHYYGWIWIMILGLLDIAFGVYLINFPQLSMNFLPVIAGCWMLFKGFTAMKNGLDMRNYGFFEWGWIFLTGIMLIILAVMMIAEPAYGAFNIILWTSFAIIFTGISRIYMSIKLKKYKNNLS